MTSLTSTSNYSMNTTTLDIDDSNNIIRVSPFIHFSATIIIFVILNISLEQTCSISTNTHLFKMRICVLLSNTLLFVLSFVMNLDLLRIDNIINLNNEFVLIVRTLQIIWLFIACFIGYFLFQIQLNLHINYLQKIL